VLSNAFDENSRPRIPRIPRFPRFKYNSASAAAESHARPIHLTLGHSNNFGYRRNQAAA
jgi:hypothetical protein